MLKVLLLVVLESASGLSIKKDIPETTELAKGLPWAEYLIQPEVGSAGHTPETAELAKSLPGTKKLRPIIFVKNHKVGSSTMTNILHRIGDARGMTFMLPLDDVNLGWPNAFPGEYQKQPKHQYDIICNHAVYNAEKMEQYLTQDQKPFKFSLVREPISHLESAFHFFGLRAGNSLLPNAGYTDLQKHMKKMGHSKKGQEILSKMMKVELSKKGIGTHEVSKWPARIEFLKALFNDTQAFDKRLVGHFRNAQAYNFGFYEAFPNGASAAEAQKWINGLDLDYVMLTEKYNEGLVLLQSKLGLNDLNDVASMHFKNRKKLDRYETDVPSDQHLSELRQLLSVDFALYDHYKEKFEKEWEAQPEESEWKALKLEKLKNLNEQLSVACDHKDEAKYASKCPWQKFADNVVWTKYLRSKQGEEDDLIEYHKKVKAQKKLEKKLHKQ